MDKNELNGRATAGGSSSDIDAVRMQMAMQQLKDNQNPAFAILGGGVAAIVGAVLWAVITAVANYQIGIMAVGIGFLVGFAVRKLGQGVSAGFGVIGAAFSLAGCVLGNYLANCAMIAHQENLGVFDVLKQVDFQTAIDIMTQSFHPLDALFYGLAVYYGYKYSFKAPVSPKSAENSTRQM